MSTQNENIILPRHIGIIMDGNGRWAQKRGMPRTMGHIQGVKALKRCINNCVELGIRYATFYAFSTENWKRPKDEVDALMLLLEKNIGSAKKANENNIKMRFIGDLSMLSESLQKKIKAITSETEKNTGLVCTIAFNYGGRNEIVNAARRIITDNINPESLTEEKFSDYLYTDGYPDVDLLLRPSGEKRISNFLIWQSAYAEFVYMDTLWPDFNMSDLKTAINEYGSRNRRFGGI